MFACAGDLDLSTQTRPQTPPYTPHRSKIQVERTSSPAPSVHPAETSSPAKLQQHDNTPVQDNVFVQELNEVEIALLRHVEYVYPAELEERSDEGRYDEDAEDGADSSSDVNGSDTGISRKLARMHCNDPEAEMQRLRQERRSSKRMSLRTYKRSHSTSIKSDLETIDNEALPDHDLSRSARRLRRKVEEQQADTIADALMSDDRSEQSVDEDSPSRRAEKRSKILLSSNPAFLSHTPATSRSTPWQVRNREAEQDDEMRLSE